jgi:hypothetical protein
VFERLKAEWKEKTHQGRRCWSDRSYQGVPTSHAPVTIHPVSRDEGLQCCVACLDAHMWTRRAMLLLYSVYCCVSAVWCYKGKGTYRRGGLCAASVGRCVFGRHEDATTTRTQTRGRLRVFICGASFFMASNCTVLNAKRIG